MDYTITQIVEQQNEIASLTRRARASLNRPFVLQYFRSTPESTESLLEVAQTSLKTWHLILDGFRELFNSQVLPTHEECVTVNAAGWLSEGDVILPWRGDLIDAHGGRVILSQNESHEYQWRYLDESGEVIREPVFYDKGFRHYAWIKAPVISEDYQEQINEIYDFQDTEIQALTQQIEYFESNAFIAA